MSKVDPIHETLSKPQPPKEVHRKLRTQEDNRYKGLVEVTISDETAHLLTVSVFSAVKPQFLRTVKIKDQGADDRNRRACEIAAGAAAEGLNEMYNDKLDPEECAKTARKLFDDTLRAFRLEVEHGGKATGVLQ